MTSLRFLSEGRRVSDCHAELGLIFAPSAKINRSRSIPNATKVSSDYSSLNCLESVQPAQRLRAVRRHESIWALNLPLYLRPSSQALR
jgi:hypothetical protein